MERDRRRTLIGESIGHAAHDTWFGIAPVLLAALSVPLKLSNSDIGLIVLLYQGVSSLAQPSFGRLSERMGGRWLAVGAICWTTLMFSIIILFPTRPVLTVCIALAGFGSAAWHPQGAANAMLAGGERRAATASAVFFLGGTLGTSILGAALGGFLLGTFGRQSLLVLSAISVLLALTVVRSTVPRRLETQAKSTAGVTSSVNGASRRAFWLIFVFLMLAIGLRSFANQSISTYVPKQQQDLGISPSTYGLVLSLFFFCTAVGALLGSYLADRVGVRRVLVGSMVLTALTLFGATHLQGLWSYVLLGATGMLIGPSHTLLVLVGQRQFPQRMAMMTGVFLGFTFFSGAGGAWLLGLGADRVGLTTALQVLPWALVAAAILSLVAVPRTASRPAPREAEPARA